jgi:phosphotransferase system HPr (HPr) family protein
VTQKIEIVIENETGLHLRPAAMFVQIASGYKANIRVCNVTRKTDYQDAKSAIGIMLLQCAKGDIISIHADGEDAVIAIASLKKLAENNFVSN